MRKNCKKINQEELKVEKVIKRQGDVKSSGMDVIISLISKKDYYKRGNIFLNQNLLGENESWMRSI